LGYALFKIDIGEDDSGCFLEVDWLDYPDSYKYWYDGQTFESLDFEVMWKELDPRTCVELDEEEYEELEDEYFDDGTD